MCPWIVPFWLQGSLDRGTLGGVVGVAACLGRLSINSLTHERAALIGGHVHVARGCRLPLKVEVSGGLFCMGTNFVFLAAWGGAVYLSRSSCFTTCSRPFASMCRRGAPVCCCSVCVWWTTTNWRLRTVVLIGASILAFGVGCAVLFGMAQRFFAGNTLEVKVVTPGRAREVPGLAGDGDRGVVSTVRVSRGESL